MIWIGVNLAKSLWILDFRYMTLWQICLVLRKNLLMTVFWGCGGVLIVTLGLLEPIWLDSWPDLRGQPFWVKPLLIHGFICLCHNLCLFHALFVRIKSSTCCAASQLCSYVPLVAGAIRRNFSIFWLISVKVAAKITMKSLLTSENASRDHSSTGKSFWIVRVLRASIQRYCTGVSSGLSNNMVRSQFGIDFMKSRLTYLSRSLVWNLCLSALLLRPGLDGLLVPYCDWIWIGQFCQILKFYQEFLKVWVFESYSRFSSPIKWSSRMSGLYSASSLMSLFPRVAFGCVMKNCNAASFRWVFRKLFAWALFNLMTSLELLNSDSKPF